MLTLASPLVWILGTLVGAGVAAWTYARPARLARRRRVLLATLRGLAFALLTLVLAEPLVRRSTPQEMPATVAVLADDSRSVGVLDSLAGRRYAPAIDAFAAAVRGPARLDRATFHRTFSAATTFEGLRFRGTKTDLAGALARAAERNAGRNLQGIVVFTDGRPTAGRDPLVVAQALGVPVFPVMLGDTSRAERARRRDVAVDALLANATVPGGSPQPVEVRVTGEGVAGQSATVRLSVNGAVVASKAVVLPPDGGIVSALLDYTPPAAGVVALAASVTQLPGEATYANNTLGRTVDVRPDRLKVLVLAGAPDPDVAVVRAALDADAGLALTMRTQKAAGTFFEGGPAPEPSAFDVAVLVGYPGPASDPALVARLAAAPRLGFVVVPTTRFDRARAATLADRLAALPGALGLAQPLALAPAGADHPALDGVPHLAALETMPPLPVAPAPAADGARVLWRTASGQPALVVERRGRQGSAVLLVGGLWRWQSLPPALAGRETLVAALVPRLVRFAAPSETGAGLTAQGSGEVFGPGETPAFSATATDELGRPVDAEVQVELSGPGGTRRVAMQAMGQGRYGLTLPDLPPGAYRWRAVGAGVPGSPGGAFRVEASEEAVVAEELRHIGPDAGLLRALAETTGGEVYTLATLDRLAQRLETGPQFRPALVARDAAVPVWDAWPLLAALLALLAAEWTLRRRWGLP